MRRFIAISFLALAACSSPQTAAETAPQAVRPDLSDDMRLPPTIGLKEDARIRAMLRDVDPAMIRMYDSMLVSFGTRNTYSDTLSPTRGNGAARRWIHATMSRFSADCGGCLMVEFDTATVETPRNPDSPRRRITNVAAWLKGRDTNRVIVIGGHYDSCICATGPGASRDSVSDAPGANDDGSGTSAIIELARVFSRAYPRGLDATVIFVAHDAEEHGLLGSRALAQRLQKSGYEILAGMTDDIVGNVTAEDGYTDSTSVRIFGADPDTSKSREFARFVWGVGELYLPRFEVFPVWRLDRFGRGGDHRPYVEMGVPGLRFTERVENEKRQHRPADVLAWVNFGYIANVVRLNAASIASLAFAPATPDSARARRDVATSGGRRWQLSWAPVKDAVAYEILLRRTTSPQYERIYMVGNATSYELNYQLDDAWAGIRAVGANGFKGLTAVVPNAAPRRPQQTQPAPRGER